MKSKVLNRLQINKVTISTIRGGATDAKDNSSHNCILRTSRSCEPISITKTSIKQSVSCPIGN